MSVVGNRKGRGRRDFGEKMKLGVVQDGEMRNAEVVWKRNGRGFVRRQGN